jgi:hypothetical protein
MLARNARGELRVSPQQYRVLLCAHILVSVGWLGVVVAKFALLLAAALADDVAVGTPLYAAVAVIDRVFPPAAISTLITGVLLGLGTKWGVFDYTWVVTKLVLTVAVPATAVRFGDRLLQQAASENTAGGLASPGEPTGLLGTGADGFMLGLETAAVVLLAMGLAHLLMLTAATIISVYKPWGKTWIGRRKATAASVRAVAR